MSRKFICFQVIGPTTPSTERAFEVWGRCLFHSRCQSLTRAWVRRPYIPSGVDPILLCTNLTDSLLDPRFSVPGNVRFVVCSLGVAKAATRAASSSGFSAITSRVNPGTLEVRETTACRKSCISKVGSTFLDVHSE